jgi:hypothetical protein
MQIELPKEHGQTRASVFSSGLSGSYACLKDEDVRAAARGCHQDDTHAKMGQVEGIQGAALKKANRMVVTNRCSSAVMQCAKLS